MDAPNESSYRDWDRENLDWTWFAYGRHPDRRTLARVRPLAVEYSERLWDWIFPATAKNHVVILVAKNTSGWLRRLFEDKPVRLTSASDLQALLHRHFQWQGSDNVFFLTRRGTGYQTEWTVYLEHCEDFLGCYEDGVLFHPVSRDVCVFWESSIYVGRRTRRKLI